MGSESSPIDLFEAVRLAMSEFPHVKFVTIVTQEVRDRLQFADHTEFQIVQEVIEMDDEPLPAIRQKKNSSLVVGLNLLQKRVIDGFVTAGNTGALIAGATLFLRFLPGIKRPALLATLPTKHGNVSVIDVGGTVASRADRLIQFARMGVAYQRACFGIEVPKVGLLNIGVESKKGTTEVRKAYDMLKADQQSRMEFVGNVEGREVFDGCVDVLVTDGFSGNIFLKTSEGVYSFIIDQLKGVLGTLSLEQKEVVFQALRSQFDYEEYMGAVVCGVDGVAVKCHGRSSARAMLNGIRGAVRLVEGRFLEQVKT